MMDGNSTGFQCMFRRFFEEGLAQSSYLIACDRTRQAAVIDPRRDVAEYMSLAAAARLTITHAVDTHVHADFASGSRELAALGALVVAGPGAGLEFEHTEVPHGRTLQVGDVNLLVQHTPGHTPEHISIIETHPAEPPRVFTGDTLFVGAVGRPDLLGAAAMRGLAGQLYESLFTTLLRLPDDVEVWPGHGAGSLCGSGIGAAAHSTIGEERRANPLLQHSSRDAFIEAVLSDLPDTPPYFARMKRLNKNGAPVLGPAAPVESPPRVSPRAAASAAGGGAWILDLRSAGDHAAGHPHGCLGIASAAKAGYWAAWIVPADSPVILLTGTEREAAEARRQLLMVGVDHIVGWIDGGFEAWAAAGLPVSSTRLIAAAQLRSGGAGAGALTVVDVRSAREWARDHVPGALHIPLQELAGRVADIPRSRPVATICEGGSRSALAAGLLERAGVRDVLNVDGGMHAWRTTESSAV
jgi:hydroxyacylglutathione hydrolase